MNNVHTCDDNVVSVDDIDDGDDDGQCWTVDAVNLTNPHPRIAIWGAILRVGNSE